MLGIKDKDFMKHCDASYKLGIRFEDFYKKGDGGFFYPFGQVDIEDNRSGLNDWYFKKLRKPKTPLSEPWSQKYLSFSLFLLQSQYAAHLGRSLRLTSMISLGRWRFEISH